MAMTKKKQQNIDGNVGTDNKEYETVPPAYTKSWLSYVTYDDNGFTGVRDDAPQWAKDQYKAYADEEHEKTIDD